MVADDDGLASQIGHVQRLGAGGPGQPAISREIHIPSGIHRLGGGIQGNGRVLGLVGDTQLDWLTGERIIGGGVPDEDGLAGQGGNIHVGLALGPSLAAVRRILHIIGGVHRLLIPVNGQVRFLTLLRDLYQYGMAGKMLRIVLLPDSQRHSVKAGQVQPIGRNGGPAVFRPVLRRGAGNGQKFGLIVDVGFRSGVPPGDGHGSGLAGGLDAITGVAHQKGCIDQVRQVHIVQAGDPACAVVRGILHRGGAVHALLGVVNGQHGSLAPDGDGHSGRVALKGIVRSRDPHQQRLALLVLHALALYAGMPCLAAIVGILHISGGVHGEIKGVYFHVRGGGALRQDLHHHGAGFAGAVIHQTDIKGRAGGHGRTVGQAVGQVVVLTGLHHIGVKGDDLLAVVNLIVQPGIGYGPPLHALAVGSGPVVRLLQPLCEGVERIGGQAGKFGAVLPCFAAVDAVFRAGGGVQRDGGCCAAGDGGRGGHGLRGLGDRHIRVDLFRAQLVGVLGHQVEPDLIGARIHRGFR